MIVETSSGLTYENFIKFVMLTTHGFDGEIRLIAENWREFMPEPPADTWQKIRLANTFERWAMCRQFINDLRFRNVKFWYDHPIGTKGYVTLENYYFINSTPRYKSLLSSPLWEEDEAVLSLFDIDEWNFRHVVCEENKEWFYIVKTHPVFVTYMLCDSEVTKPLMQSTKIKEIESFVIEGKVFYRSKDFLNWAQSKGFPIPEPLQPLINSSGNYSPPIDVVAEKEETVDLPSFEVKKRAASVRGPAKGRSTRKENAVALRYISYWRDTLGWTDRQIAEELFNKGAENPVIGYLLSPESEDLSVIDSTAAAKRGRRYRGLN